jgi:hypothetical protein
MLRYFINYTSLEHVNVICQLLDQVKKRIERCDYSDGFQEYNTCKDLFDEVLEYAKQIGNEKLANAQYVFKQYFLLFCNLSTYFYMLQNKEYRGSWSKLQDCIDVAKFIGKFVEIGSRLEVPDIIDLLSNYESLYPYTVFASSEYIITRSHCSICGKSMQSLECQHISGNLYWGQVAIEIIDDIKEFQAVCLVSHPEDKRCILELSDDTRSELEKFKKIDQFLDLGQPFLQNFSVTTKIETRMREDINIVGRNDPCSCGSGLKFKKCCGKNLYYKHERNIVAPHNSIELLMTNNIRDI